MDMDPGEQVQAAASLGISNANAMFPNPQTNQSKNLDVNGLPRAVYESQLMQTQHVTEILAQQILGQQNEVYSQIQASEMIAKQQASELFSGIVNVCAVQPIAKTNAGELDAGEPDAGEPAARELDTGGPFVEPLVDLMADEEEEEPTRKSVNSAETFADGPEINQNATEVDQTGAEKLQEEGDLTG